MRDGFRGWVDFQVWRIRQAKTLLTQRFLGRCQRDPDCRRRPAWRYDPDHTHGYVSCDEHVVRGCCYPYGTTVCSEWVPLPFSKVT